MCNQTINPVLAKNNKMKNNRNGKAAILKPQEYASIRKAIKSEKYKLLLDIAWFTGERWGAIIQLEILDIYDEDGKVRDFITFKAETRKASPDGKRKTRQVPTHDTLREILINYKVTQENKFLFPNRLGNKPMGFRYADRVLRTAVEKVGLSSKGISTHSTRRSFITLLWEKGVDLKTIKSITGHQSFEVLEGYIQDNPQRTRSAINLI